MKIAFFSTKSYDRYFFEKFNKNNAHELTYFKTPLNQGTANLTQGQDVVCVFVNDKLDAATIVHLAENGIKLIALRCAGFNNVDLKAATENNIKIVRVPSYSPEAVAEHAVALLLTLNRKTHKAYNRVREHNFSLERLTGFDLFKKKVGVVGTGKIGQAFCRIMLGFGCRVLAFDIYPNEELQKKGVEYVAFESLLSASDIISLHCPLNEHTHHLIDKSAFSKMKKGAMLINTSRGGLVDTKAAIKALKKEKLGYLGIDVYEQEEKLFFQDLSESIVPDDVIVRLMTFPNVLITSHQGFLTQEALEEIAKTTLENISEFEKGIKMTNEVG